MSATYYLIQGPFLFITASLILYLDLEITNMHNLLYTSNVINISCYNIPSKFRGTFNAIKVPRNFCMENSSAEPQLSSAEFRGTFWKVPRNSRKVPRNSAELHKSSAEFRGIPRNFEISISF